MTITLTKEYIQMLIGLLESDGNNTKNIVKEKLQNLIKGDQK